MSDVLVRTKNISVRYGGHIALMGVDVDAVAGQVTGLIGPNGAGKTTCFNAITGLLTPTEGAVELDGADVTALPPHKRAHRGLARTFQRLELFTSLTVRDNVLVAGEIRRAWKVFGPRTSVTAEAERIIDLVGLRSVADEEVSSIPTGTARLVELGRALMTRPKVLLLDEPASGQTEEETEAFGRLLVHLAREEGLAILLVEHDMDLVMKVCDRIYVLDFGRIIANGTPEEIRTDPAVLSAYLGEKKE